ncbi:MAG: FtsX-like permease family protein [Candidatus Sumerlaeota bacterium]|nr:FtsX-like permease family protein [Candidatus Sumerlaeota bacterium]
MILRLLGKEIWHRKINFALTLAGIAAAVALFVALLTAGRASEDETRRLMLKMKFNLIVLPKATDMAAFWATDMPQGDLPEEDAARLAKSPALDAEHYVATLQQKIDWQGRQALLTGVAREISSGGKKAMGYEVPEGACLVGYELANALNLKKKDQIEVLGTPLRVDNILVEDGSKEDIRLYVNLRDAQKMLNKPGRINSIQALSCQCYGQTVADLRKQLATLLPDAQIVEYRSIALARAEQRELVARYVSYIVLAALVGAAAWVGVLAFLNVRERRTEIGLLRALGYGSWKIFALFLGRAILAGVIGAAAGFAVGTEWAIRYGAPVFEIVSQTVAPLYSTLGWALVIAPLVAALGSLIPAMLAVAEDPAVALMEE